MDNNFKFDDGETLDWKIIKERSEHFNVSILECLLLDIKNSLDEIHCSLIDICNN